MKHIVLTGFIMLNAVPSFSQDIISSDGFSMGPRSVFIEVCTENMAPSTSSLPVLYSIPGFCNCMADELLPTLTRSQMDYYFAQEHMDELVEDSLARTIISECTLKNLHDKYKNGQTALTPAQVIPPPEVITRGATRDSIVRELVVLCDYESYFNSSREKIIAIISEENTASDTQIAKIRDEVTFSDFDMIHFYSAYSIYTEEELVTILEYFKEMTSEELARSNVKHEKVVLMNIDGNMVFRVKKSLDQ